MVAGFSLLITDQIEALRKQSQASPLPTAQPLQTMLRDAQRLFKPPHLGTVDTWIGNELEVDLPNVPVCFQPGAGLAPTTPHDTERRRHLTPTLPETVPRPQQEVQGDSRTQAPSSPT